MKLNQIAEGYVLQKLRDSLSLSDYTNRPVVRSNNLYNATSGHDSGARSSGFSTMPIGIPYKTRQRQFFGMGPLYARPGSIKLVY